MLGIVYVHVCECVHVCVHMWIKNLYDSVSSFALVHLCLSVCAYVLLIVIILLYGRPTEWNTFGAGFLKYDDVIEAYCYVVEIGRIMSRCVAQWVITDTGRFGYIRVYQLHTKLKILQCETGYIANLTNGAT